MTRGGKLIGFRYVSVSNAATHMHSNGRNYLSLAHADGFNWPATLRKMYDAREDGATSQLTSGCTESTTKGNPSPGWQSRDW